MNRSLDTGNRYFQQMEKPKIFIIDDNEAFLELFPLLPEAEEFTIIPFTSARNALDAFERDPADLIVTDIQMPEMSGVELFKRFQDLRPDIPAILITAFGSTEEAVRAVRKGAFHYFEKPIDDKLPLFWSTVREALAKGRMSREIALLQKEKELRRKIPPPIIGCSDAIHEILLAIEEVAPLPATVLVSGETGTGKELVARLIHEKSDRSSQPFFVVSCGEFAPGVLESELFGHERGAFTGAANQRIGLFEMVNKGTLFLDELNDASPELQKKLLRVLETKRFTRVGSSIPLYSDFRVLAATNEDLETSSKEGRFRKDLFFRINVFQIRIPPLRHRKEDIPLIAEFYLKQLTHKYGRPIGSISESALIALRDYDWPGNVRELINIMERAVITCDEPMITTKHLPFDAPQKKEISDLNLKNMEKFYIDLTLRRTGGNKTKAANLLGISRKTLIEKTKKYNLGKRSFPDGK